MPLPADTCIMTVAPTCIACNAPDGWQEANRNLYVKLLGARSVLQDALDLLANQVPPIMPGLRSKIAKALELTQP